MIVRIARELLDQIARGAAGDLDLLLLAAVLVSDLVVHAAGDVDDDSGREPLPGGDGRRRRELLVDSTVGASQPLSVARITTLAAAHAEA